MKKKRLIEELLTESLHQNDIGYAWRKKQDKYNLSYWRQKNQSFIGNRIMYCVYQGLCKGNHIATYDLLWSFALGCYFYTNPLVDAGPMRPFFLTKNFVNRIRKQIEGKPPKAIQKRIWFYRARAVYIQFLHTVGLDEGAINAIDTAPLDYQNKI